MFMASNQERDGFDPMIRAELLMALRSFGISDQRILAAIEKIDRQKFVEGPVQRYALEDIALPIDCGQTTSAPSVIAAALVAADLDPRHKLLEIGTGSGYQTAILACLVKRVFTIDRYRTLVEAAKRRFINLKLDNIFAIHGDGMLGWSSHSPFDRIIISAAYEKPPQRLIDQLVDGGKLVMPVGAEGNVQQLTLFTKYDNEIKTKIILPVRFVPLVSGKAKSL